MATVNYRVKGTTNQSTILLRFKQGRISDNEISTGLHIQRKHWSKPKQRVKLMVGSYDYAGDINNHLQKLKSTILENYSKDQSNGISINQKWLKEQVNKYFYRPDKISSEYKIFLVPFIENYIKKNKDRLNKNTGKPLSLRTFQIYEACKNKLEAFEKEKGIRVKLADVNLNFHTNFQDFLTVKQLLNPNSIGKYFDNIKLFCRKAELQGLEVHPEVRSREFYSPQKKSENTYLNENEIQQITNFDFSNSDRLDNARDWLVIGVWTGLRVSDLLRLDTSFIKNDMINITAFKTGINVIIPLHPTVKSILTKRNGEFPRRISDQKFNDYIKDVCELVGIKKLVNGYKMTAIQNDKKTVFRKIYGKYKKYELVSSHICRRSFATNHYGKIDTLTIMKITGHKTEKQFLDYIKRTPTQYAEQLKALWDSTK